MAVTCISNGLASPRRARIGRYSINVTMPIEDRMADAAVYLGLKDPSFQAMLDWVLGLRAPLDIPETAREPGVEENRLDELSEKPVRQHLAPDRRPTTGPFTAMMAPHPVASRSPDRKGVRYPGQDAPSTREKAIGRAFDCQIGPTKKGDRYADCRIRAGFDLDRHICYATSDREWSSG